VSTSELKKGRCPRCQSLNRGIFNGNGVRCWKCGAVLRLKSPPAPVEKEAEVEPEPQAEPPIIVATLVESQQNIVLTGPYSYSIASLLLLTTAAAVLCGVAVASPNLAILLAILGTPPIIRTALLTRRAQMAGRHLSKTQQAGLFLASFGVTAVLYQFVMVVSGVAAVATVLFACFAQVFASNTMGNSTWPFIVLVTAVFSLIMIGFFFYIAFVVIRARWRYDVARFTAPTSDGNQQ